MYVIIQSQRFYTRLPSLLHKSGWWAGLYTIAVAPSLVVTQLLRSVVMARDNLATPGWMDHNVKKISSNESTIAFLSSHICATFRKENRFWFCFVLFYTPRHFLGLTRWYLSLRKAISVLCSQCLRMFGDEISQIICEFIIQIVCKIIQCSCVNENDRRSGNKFAQ